MHAVDQNAGAVLSDGLAAAKAIYAALRWDYGMCRRTRSSPSYCCLSAFSVATS